ncbi:MAG: MFS transporter [Candidatus Lokiarchaeota archaeon]|nr:MFS transporter [Candidatus Lokiarchaeota archaeon]
MNIITENLANQQTFKNYLFFWIGQLFSILGSSITHFVIIWWITITTGSILILSIASFIYILPMTLIIPIAGVLADKLSRKKIIITVDSLQAFITFIVMLLFNFEMANPVLIIAINGLLGLFQGFHIPTLNAIIPTMVPKDKLSRLNGVSFLFSSFLQTIGPIIAAMLLSFIPIKIILWVDPITFLIAVIPLLLITIPSIKAVTKPDKKNSFLEDFKVGFRTLKSIPVVLMMLLVAMFVNFLWRPFGILMPYFVRFDHSGTASELAFVLAFMNGGMILGALIASFKKEWKRGVSIYFVGEFTLMLAYAIVAISPHGFFLQMGIGAAILGIMIPILNTISLTTIQIKVPADKMGRISSIDFAVSMAISPIGAIISGPLAELFGIANLFLYCAILGMVITIIFWWMAHIRFNNNDNKEELEKVEVNIDEAK